MNIRVADRWRVLRFIMRRMLLILSRAVTGMKRLMKRPMIKKKRKNRERAGSMPAAEEAEIHVVQMIRTASMAETVRVISQRSRTSRIIWVRSA